MEVKWMTRCLRFCAVACLAVLGLAAAEHHGVVKFGTVPVPGATVTATKGDKKMVAVTDEAGAYIFPDLEDGVWTIQVEMLTFAPVTKDIGVADGAPGAEWQLKLLSMDEIKPILQAAPAPGTAPAGTSTPAAAPGTTPAAAATPQLSTAPAANAAPAKSGRKGLRSDPLPGVGVSALQDQEDRHRGGVR